MEKIKLATKDIQNSLNNGEEAETIFDSVELYPSPTLKVVYMKDKGWNILDEYNHLWKKSEKWIDSRDELYFLKDSSIYYDKVYKFHDGLAVVYKKGKGYNFIDKSGKILIPNEWFFDAGDFEKGVTIVIDRCYVLKYLLSDGTLLTVDDYLKMCLQKIDNGEDPKELFNDVGKFVEGFAIIWLEGKGWNFLTSKNKLLWKGEEWFNEVSNFKNGFAYVLLDNHRYNINTKGKLQKL